MAIDLSNVAFTDKADIIPEFGVQEISNHDVVDTLAGNDRLTGTSFENIGFDNRGALYTSDGNDRIVGNSVEGRSGLLNNVFFGVIDTGEGNDVIVGIGTHTTGLFNSGTILTHSGRDTITGLGKNDSDPGFGLFNVGFINTGSGGDSLFGRGNIGILNAVDAVIDTNFGLDTIIGVSQNNVGIENQDDGLISTGSGTDVITGSGTIGVYNRGVIDMGDGRDSLSARRGGFLGSGDILLGRGRDIVAGFLQGFGSGSAGYGIGSFYGGEGKDTLQFTAGSYVVGILGDMTSFTRGNHIMHTYEFEVLKAGNQTYSFDSLANGQTITVG